MRWLRVTGVERESAADLKLAKLPQYHSNSLPQMGWPIHKFELNVLEEPTSSVYHPPNDDEQKASSFRANAAMETAMSQETSLPTGSAPLRSTFKWHTAERGSLERPDTFHIRSWFCGGRKLCSSILIVVDWRNHKKWGLESHQSVSRSTRICTKNHQRKQTSPWPTKLR